MDLPQPVMHESEIYTCHSQVVAAVVRGFQAASGAAACALRILPRALALLSAAGTTVIITGAEGLHV